MKKPTLLTLFCGALLGVTASANAVTIITAGDVNKAVSAVKQISHLAQSASREQFPLQAAAIPEPSTWALIALSIPVLLLVAYRRRKKAA
jgi:hypothetical protein